MCECPAVKPCDIKILWMTQYHYFLIFNFIINIVCDAYLEVYIATGCEFFISPSQVNKQ